MPRYKKIASQRWPFRYRLKNGQQRTYWMKAILAKHNAYPILRAEHVRESIARRGVADTQNCAEAICAQRNPDAFYHPVEGTIDFTYRRAAVVSKIYREPRPFNISRTKYVMGECVVYEHSHADIAKLNDTPGGQKKLLAMLEANGPLQQTFRALKILNKTWKTPAPGKRTGQRTRYRRGKARQAFALAASELVSK